MSCGHTIRTGTAYGWRARQLDLVHIAGLQSRLEEIERLRASAYWAAHMASARYRPMSGALWEERARIRSALRELGQTIPWRS